jgi:hypothetical protein
VGSVANGRIGLQAVAVMIRDSSGRRGRSGRARRQIQKHVSHNYRGATGFQLLMHRQETSGNEQPKITYHRTGHLFGTNCAVP